MTDRFSTTLGTLDAGNYRLASLDLDSGAISPLPGFEKGKNINPQWAADGKSLYFLSDRSGITNIYRLDLRSRASLQLTDFISGVSGITALSPALSSAAGADRLAYSVYEDGRYEIYAIEGTERLAGWTIPSEEPLYAGVIPGAKPVGAVIAAREDPVSGLTGERSFTTEPYKPKLQLDYLGQPYVMGGADRYGAFFGGGVSMMFSDMLGNHTLSTAIQANSVSGFTDVGALVGYVNRERRFNWGVQALQIPYVTGQFGAVIADVSGDTVYLEQSLIQRQIERGFAAQGYYPFDSTLRAEVAAGYRHLSFDSRLETSGFSLATGQLVIQEKQKLDSPPSIHLWESTVALVRDTSLQGPTSPILGQRFRVDVTPVFGTINYTGALADFRQYFMPVRPITLAGRVMHYGRYGSGGEDPRLLPLFLGYPSLVRG